MKSSKQKPAKLDAKIERVQAKHTFSPNELIELGQEAGRHQGEFCRLEGELASVKKDYGAKMELAECHRDTAFRKLRDGFEMREVEGIIIYNKPKKGFKTVHFHLPGEKNTVGDVIREETMSPADLQTELRLIEAAKSPKTPAPKPGEPLNPVADAVAHAEENAGEPESEE